MIAYSEFSDADREAIVAAYPRTEHFKEDILQAFYDGIKQAGDDIRQCKGRCTGGQGSNVPARQLLQCYPRFEVEGLSNPGAAFNGTPAVLLDNRCRQCNFVC